MDIEDLHLACLAQIPEGGGPCRLELEDLVESKKQVRAPQAREDGLKLFARVTESDRARALQRPPLILSCSRRTDVPWAFLRQYLKAFREGFMYVRSPVTRLVTIHTETDTRQETTPDHALEFAARICAHRL